MSNRIRLHDEMWVQIHVNEIYYRSIVFSDQLLHFLNFHMHLFPFHLIHMYVCVTLSLCHTKTNAVKKDSFYTNLINVGSYYVLYPVSKSLHLFALVDL